MKPKKELVQHFGFIFFGVSIALLGEHIISKGFTDWELFGHETYGLIAIIVSYILLKRTKTEYFFILRFHIL